MHPSWSRIKVLPGVFGIAVGVGAVFIYLGFTETPQAERTSLWAEMFKTGLEVIAVGVLGGIISFALQVLGADREKRQRETEYRRDVLQALRTAYSDTKRVRTQLRAAGLTTRYGPGPPCLDKRMAEAYKTLMTDLYNTKLAFEDVLVMIDVLPVGTDGTTPSSQIAADVKLIEVYIDAVVDEYADHKQAIDEDPADFKYAKLSKLDGFTGYSYPAHASTPFHRAEKALQNDILGRKPPRPGLAGRRLPTLPPPVAAVLPAVLLGAALILHALSRG